MVIDLAEDGEEVVVVGDEQPVGDCADAPCAQGDLVCGLLTGGVEDRAGIARGESMGDGEQQGRLADTGLASDEHHLAGHEAPADHAVELAGPGRKTTYALVGDLRDGLRRAHRCRGLAGLDGLRRWRRGDLGDGAELLALGAAAHPAQRRRPAGVALVGDARLGHVGRLRARSDARCPTPGRQDEEPVPGARGRGPCAAPPHGPGSTPPGRRRPSCP